MSTYTVRIGTRRAKTTARDLFAIPTRKAEDDDTILRWITGAETTWGWNEGPCACGGIMRWAEAGYVSWHRICDRCGSHWDLHPVTIYLRPYDEVRRVTGMIHPPTMIQRTDGSLWLAEIEGSTDQDVHDEQQRVRRLLTGDMITDDMCRDGAIYGGWAHRARFYAA